LLTGKTAVNYLTAVLETTGASQKRFTLHYASSLAGWAFSAIFFARTITCRTFYAFGAMGISLFFSQAWLAAIRACIRHLFSPPSGTKFLGFYAKISDLF
jgi:hypothetical protein